MAKVADLENLIECPICYEIFLPPIYNCENGHSICNQCRNQINNCSICKGELTNNRSITLESIVTNILKNCKNEEFGCKKMLKSNEIEIHQTNCDYKPFVCNYENGQKCKEFKIAQNSYLKHLEEFHGTLCIPIEIDQKHEFVCGIMSDLENYQMRKILFKFIKNGVEVTYILNEKNKSGYIYWWLSCFDKVDDQINELSLYPNDKKFPLHLWVDKIFSPWEEFDEIEGLIISKLHMSDLEFLNFRITFANWNMSLMIRQYEEFPKSSFLSTRIPSSKSNIKIKKPAPMTPLISEEIKAVLVSFIRDTLPQIPDKDIKSMLVLCDYNPQCAIDKLLIKLGSKRNESLAIKNIAIEGNTTITWRANGERDVKRHFGVTCDICYSVIYGFRYKCISCNNYDLCNNCEKNGHHSHHLFYRISNSFLNASLHDLMDKTRFSFKVTNQTFSCKNKFEALCDVCYDGVQIKGIRYKCIQCDDYDHCQNCERNENHREHIMIRCGLPDLQNALGITYKRCRKIQGIQK